MNFTFNHNNLNVLDLEKSLDFYKKALGLEVVRKKEASDGSFILALILSILVYTFFSRMFDLMLPPVAKHSIVVA